MDGQKFGLLYCTVISRNYNQRTNGPVNAHLSLLHIPINMLNIMVFNPSAGADEALGPFSFFRIINILSICQFLAGFCLQMTFLTVFPIQMHGQPMLTLP